ncbi:ABC transporter ATP-binding protein [Massilistercora timonensis]|uniref:ABC transporter ATP-binding protein n=1 Tax=Massilistercora timonensis TaxID=2086584 RepID=UPI003AB2835E
MEILKVQGLKKRFTDRGEGEPVLSGASFRLEEGTFTALTGISGAGKTTLIHLLAGLQEPDEGQVFLLGRDLGEMKEEERTLFRRRHISLVLQEGALLPGLTVEENILLPMAMDTGRLVEEERLEQILEALGLTRLRRRFPARLSGGERQRVVLGRALLSDAEIILADEPCARLDRRQSLEIMGLLRECAGTWNRTVLMATHDLDLAQICDQILVLRDGQIFPW